MSADPAYNESSEGVTMTDAALPPAPAVGAPAPAVAMPGSVASAAQVTAEGGIMPGFAQMLGGMQGGEAQALPVPPIARATVALPKPQPAEVESPLLPSPIVPSQNSSLPVARVAAEVPKVPETQPEATDTDSEKTEIPPAADETVALMVPPAPPPAAAPTPPLVPHQPPPATATPEELSDNPEAPSPSTQIASKRQDAPAAVPLLSDAKEPRIPGQLGHVASSAEQHDEAFSLTPPLNQTLPDQPLTPSAPARAATPTISTAPGRFGEELGIAIARHASRGDIGAAETLSLRLDPPEHGRIEVTLSFEDGGPLRAVVAASQPATLDLLRRDSADLNRALGQAGIATDAQSFSFSAQSQSGGRERQGLAFAHPPTLTNDRAMPPEEVPMPTPDYRRLNTSGRLNLIA